MCGACSVCNGLYCRIHTNTSVLLRYGGNFKFPVSRPVSAERWTNGAEDNRKVGESECPTGNAGVRARAKKKKKKKKNGVATRPRWFKANYTAFKGNSKPEYWRTTSSSTSILYSTADRVIIYIIYCSSEACFRSKLLSKKVLEKLQHLVYNLPRICEISHILIEQGTGYEYPMSIELKNWTASS